MASKSWVDNTLYYITSLMFVEHPQEAFLNDVKQIMECYATPIRGSNFYFFTDLYCACNGLNARFALPTKEGGKKGIQTNQGAVTKYPRRNDTNPEQRTRSAVTNKLDEAVGGKIITTTCINDAAKLWNGAPDSIKNCVSIYSVKKCIKAYTSTLPL